MKQSPLEIALTFYGEKPIPGDKNNEQIVAFLEASGQPKDTTDEVPWCSAFLVYCFQQACIQTPANAAARSWLNYSTETDTPKLGDVVVLAWPIEAPVHAHVGLFIREVENGIYLLAGNQRNTVDIVLWKKQDVLSYRRYMGV